MTTAVQLFREALTLSNSVGSDQTLTDQEAQDCLSVINDVIENWSTQSLAVFGQANQTFNSVANQATYTIGVGGDWNTTRPVRIKDPAYSTYQGVTFPCTSMTQGEYDIISLKTQPNIYPYRYLYVNENPLGLITLWPVPNQVTPITFPIERVLTQIAALNTVLAFPPGYRKAFKYAVAVEAAPMFGSTVPPEVAATAVKSLADIKRANQSQRRKVMRSGIEYSDMGSGYPGGPYDWISYP